MASIARPLGYVALLMLLLGLFLLVSASTLSGTSVNYSAPNVQLGVIVIVGAMALFFYSVRPHAR